MSENKMPRKVRRQIERHLRKKNNKKIVKDYNETYETEKFFNTVEGQEFMNELVKLYIENEQK